MYSKFAHGTCRDQIHFSCLNSFLDRKCFSDNKLSYLQRVPGNELQADQRAKEPGQTEGDVSVSVTCGIFFSPLFKSVFHAVEGMEVLQHILKDFLRFPYDAICVRSKVSFSKRLEIFVRGKYFNICISPFSMLKLVMSVEVSSSSDDKPSLCSALFPFCSLACRRRVLQP